ncbi:tellurite-resistance/dicarboxylate transporter (TDT) family protein [Abortiporus biennis]
MVTIANSQACSSEVSVAKGKTLKDCVRHFTPAWFAAIMGTGAISILFHSFPYATNSTPMKIFTYIFFFLNLFLFILFNALSIFRYAIFPDIWSIMIRHPTQSLFLGTYPMGAATLISIGAGRIYEDDGFGGRPFLYFLWALWWSNVALSFACAFEIVHIMKTKQDHALNRMTAIWLLPVVTLIVCSSTGGILASSLVKISRNNALITLAVSAFMVSAGLALAFMILTMYLLRLIVYGLPPGSSILSVFIPLGPMGQGGYSILLLGSGFRSVLPLWYGKSQLLRNGSTGETISVICTCISFVLWSLATMWMFYAVLALLEVVPKTKLPFKVPFWGLIFPNGVYANLTVQLARTFDSQFFRVWGSIYSVATLLLWMYVFGRTLAMVRNGAIFEAPCLEDIDMTRGLEKRNDDRSQSTRREASGCPGTLQ